TTQSTLSSVAVLTNQSTNAGIAFSPVVFNTVDNTPVGLAVHLNSLNVVDKVATANSQGNDATVLTPRSNGKLQVSSEIGLQSSVPSAVMATDLNNDFLPDLIVANLPAPSGFLFTDNVTIFIN